MDTALIITNNEKSATLLHEMLLQASISSITTIMNGTEARRELIEQEFDVCIINAPLKDEFGETLAKHIARTTYAEVILMVKAELYDDITHTVESDGIITISKPFNRTMLWSALKLAGASHYRIKRMQKEQNRLLQKIEDIRIVDRAKCLLIANFSMQEQDAHRYIEKQAMDMRMTKREVAEEILRTYDD